ncbi:MAG: MaoC family dehydratase N-terminal domain-containing protein, partial [Chloroflexi bacterium]|nr:MaoC family dehydratase N-terminal domain-containing protein [Chloroflexota bacterium]
MESARISPEGVALLKERLGLDLRLHRHNDIASKDGIKRFAFAIGDANPLWSDAGYAARTRYAGLVAPPCFLYSVVCPSGDLAGGLPSVHSFHGGNDWQFYRPVTLNDSITVKAKLIDVAEKK